MSGERLVVKQTRNGLSREINRGDFFANNAKSFAASKRYFDDVTGKKFEV